MQARLRGTHSALKERRARRMWPQGAVSDLHEVDDDHLTFFEGDELCERCAMDHGIL
jgi:hypothetical protein